MKTDDMLMLKENLEILAKGKDPQTGYRVEDTILKSSFNRRVLTEAAEIIDLLLKIDFNPTKIDKRKKYSFYIPKENREKVEISKEPIPISVFAYAINECIDSKKMKKIKASQITAWLMKEGYLDEIESSDGKTFKVLTDKSPTIGITAEDRRSDYGRVYKVNLYDENGQRFILDHLDDIVGEDTDIL
ncbi:MAG: hypothetical protein ACOX81_03740 [Candidatus Heteroscillospira sp.]|jgi:hypothetical protein